MSTGSLHHLPLRLLGLRHVPAIPVTFDGLLGSLVRLGIRAEEVKQAAHGLNNVYTIGDTTLPAFPFLFGLSSSGGAPAVRADGGVAEQVAPTADRADRAAGARQELATLLAGRPAELLRVLLEQLGDEADERLRAGLAPRALRTTRRRPFRSTIRSSSRSPGRPSPTSTAPPRRCSIRSPRPLPTRTPQRAPSGPRSLVMASPTTRSSRRRSATTNATPGRNASPKHGPRRPTSFWRPAGSTRSTLRSSRRSTSRR